MATTETSASTTWTVSALTLALKATVENAFPFVSVQGEISNCKMQASGHLYFTLKDAQAQIAAVMFRADSTLDFEPKNGDLVVVEGALNVYAPAGRYQINVAKMQKQGLGHLLLLLEERKRAIARRGWFRPEHKKRLPLLPRRIGVVTSPTGAAIRDIIHVLTRRAGSFQMILNPVKVQGEGAAEEIAAAIEFFNAHLPVDVLLVGRGGGSFEDLWCFNDEAVAAAIFNSRIPIICAVGHETDHCIAEHVADMRAPTPSAAAEMITAEQQQLRHQLKQLCSQIDRALTGRLGLYRERMSWIKQQPCIKRPRALLEPYMQRLDDLSMGLKQALSHRLQRLKLLVESQRRLLAARDPIARLQQWKGRLGEYNNAIHRAINHHIWQRKQALQALQRTLQAIDPSHLLAKGFSVLFAEKDGSVITDASAVNVGDTVRIRLAQGHLRATIHQVITRE